VVKKLSLMATLVAAVIAPGIVRAEDDDGKKDVEVRVETKVFGEVMTIGPDGKVTVEKFGDDEAAGEKKGRRGKKPAKQSDTSFFHSGKAFKIGPDGKMEGVESLPEEIQELLKQAKPGTVSVDGSVTIIGPDGKKHTHALGDGELDAESISKSIEEALQGAGRGLPKEIQGQLKEALKGLPSALKVQIDGAIPKGKDTMSRKLDEILRRLDKLEKEVRDLKANHK
jgi:hypothetical protein